VRDGEIADPTGRPLEIEPLIARLAERSARIGVIGLGYMTLPLVRRLAEQGFAVLGFDIDPDKVERLNRGGSYIRHIAAESTPRCAARGGLRRRPISPARRARSQLCRAHNRGACAAFAAGTADRPRVDNLPGYDPRRDAAYPGAIGAALGAGISSLLIHRNGRTRGTPHSASPISRRCWAATGPKRCASPARFTMPSPTRPCRSVRSTPPKRWS
jgi:UDP-glucose/GDP-mannose dehydrogenase family protein